jgi:hypothetical protein
MRTASPGSALQGTLHTAPKAAWLASAKGVCACLGPCRVWWSLVCSGSMS